MNREDYSDIRDIFFPGFVIDKGKYLNLFKNIKSEIYKNLYNLPEISEIISFRNEKDMVILEYLINNDSEYGIINNIFSEDGDNMEVTTYIVTFKNKKFNRDITLYSSFYKENDKDYFEMCGENIGIYFKKEIKKEENSSKKL